MKNKIVIFLSIIVSFLALLNPIIAHGADRQLHITVYTDSNSTFTFNLATYIAGMGMWVSGGPFYVTTDNLVGAAPVKTISENPPEYPPSYYRLVETAPQDFKLNRVDCYCDNGYHPLWVFSYSDSGVYISPQNTTSPECSQNFYCDFYNTKIKTPVLIVPGLTGTELKDGNELLWADVDRMFIDVGDNFMDTLQFKNDLSPIESSTTTGNIIKKLEAALGLINYDYTDGLINEFKNQGYAENVNLFTFPYDWRYGVTGKNADGKTNSDLLGEKISQIVAQTGASEIDIVAHSMGGLIVKKYAMDNPTNNRIGRAVFAGVPNTGAPKSAKILLQGDSLGIPWLADSEIKKIATNMPAAYDLLPSQQYYNTKGSYIETIDRTKCFDDPLIPCDVKDLNYQDSSNFLTSQGLNSLGISNATNLHTQTFDNFDMRIAGVDLYAIDGCKAATLSKIVQTKYNDIFGQQFSYDRRLAPGDNTVPLESATNLPIDQSKKYYALVSDHGKMLSQNGIRQEIVNLIFGSRLDTGTAYGQPIITQDINLCQLNGKAISVFSPVDVFVTDQNGNRAGLADDGSIINEIPNADFEVWGEHKFLYLPQDSNQTYTIGMRGTGAGTYTIESKSIVNDKLARSEIFSGLPVTAELTGQIIINPQDNSTTLSVEQNADAQPETILPTKTIDYASDTTSPEAVIKFDLSVKDLTFTGTDNLSENSSVSVLDDGGKVTFTDEAGNTTEIQFTQKNRRAAMSATISSIKYNNSPVSITSNSMVYSWSFDKSGNLAKLSQKATSRNNYSITAVYDGTKTKITGTTATGKISQTFAGLKIIKITTDKGNLSWGY